MTQFGNLDKSTLLFVEFRLFFEPQVSSALFQRKSGQRKEAKEVWEVLRALDDLCHARFFKEQRCIRYLQVLIVV